MDFSLCISHYYEMVQFTKRVYKFTPKFTFRIGSWLHFSQYKGLIFDTGPAIWRHWRWIVKKVIVNIEIWNVFECWIIKFHILPNIFYFGTVQKIVFVFFWQQKQAGYELGNCNKFYFTFNFKVQIWVQIYAIFERDWIPIHHIIKSEYQ